jgi:benzoyl-CoA reductase/2-hydroxyglutaryl-CoA dehydratase subunit BcrC/BadD/HgdB
MGLAERRAGAAVVFSTHCDQLRRGFDVAASRAACPLFLFNLPATWQSAAARQIYTAELERLGRFLVELGGHAPSEEGLEQVLTDYQAARSSLLEAAARLPARAFVEALAGFYGHGFAEVAEDERQARADGIPLALLGGPLPRSRWQLLDMIEDAGGRVVLNATEPGERNLWDASPPAAGPGTSGAKGGPVERLAASYLDHCIDVFQRPNIRLYDWLKERLAARKARGIVLWHYVGCDLWRAEAQPLREAFGLPVLLLDADEAASDSARNAGRIQAFVESLR